MYTKTPELYDRFYDWKDYAGEAAKLRDLIESRSPGARSLLDVACGTGRHLEHLRAWYDVEGVDLDEGLLSVARARLPDVPLRAADMRDFDLGRRFDVVTCLFSSIGYVQTPGALQASVAAMVRHVAPGGAADRGTVADAVELRSRVSRPRHRRRRTRSGRSPP